MIERGDNDVGRVAVQSVDRDVQIALFRLRGDAGGGSAPHHVDDDRRHFGGDGETDGLGHQGDAGARSGRQRRDSAVGRPDHHVDGSEFVLRLHQAAAQLLQARR